MGNFSKAVLIASVALCLHLSAFSQDISLKAKQITVKEAIELLKEKSGYSFVFSSAYNPQIQISAESETKRSIFREKDKTKRSKKESAQHSKSRNKSFVMTSVSAL